MELLNGTGLQRNGGETERGCPLVMKFGITCHTMLKRTLEQFGLFSILLNKILFQSVLLEFIDLFQAELRV